jgi:hypothetical protein
MLLLVVIVVGAVGLTAAALGIRCTIMLNRIQDYNDVFQRRVSSLDWDIHPELLHELSSLDFVIRFGSVRRR